MSEREHPAAGLESDAGKPAPDSEGVITNMTERRREMLERLAADPDEPGPVTPDQAAGPSDANKQVYEAERAGRQSVKPD